jgi:hypothetical protein
VTWLLAELLSSVDVEGGADVKVSRAHARVERATRARGARTEERRGMRAWQQSAKSRGVVDGG